MNKVNKRDLLGKVRSMKRYNKLVQVTESWISLESGNLAPPYQSHSTTVNFAAMSGLFSETARAHLKWNPLRFRSRSAAQCLSISTFMVVSKLYMYARRRGYASQISAQSYEAITIRRPTHLPHLPPWVLYRSSWQPRASASQPLILLPQDHPFHPS